MIVSVSRRTDIPCCYAGWFFRRLDEGFALVRNPMNFHQVSRVSLRKEDVSGFVFWTKNPLPMMERLEELEGCCYYFQFTLNGYGAQLEPGLPEFSVLAGAFRHLAEKIGSRRVLWRYDPILLGGPWTAQFHLRNFRKIASALAGYTEVCTVSFVDFYSKVRRKLKELGLAEPPKEERESLLRELAAAGEAFGISVRCCAEDSPLLPARCVDGRLFDGVPVLKKDKNQRRLCSCHASADIGAYDSCRTGCVYCYACRPAGAAACHDGTSPMLLGRPGPGDRISRRPAGRGRG